MSALSLLRSLSRPLVEYRVILSFGLSAACGVLLDSRYPVEADNPFLQLVALERPAIFHGLVWSYDPFLYSTPFVVIAILFSLAYIHLYEPRPDQVAGELPSYLEPRHRASLCLTAGEVHHQLKPEPSPAMRSLSIPERGLYTGVCVIGAIGSGKKTLLNVLSDAIPKTDRILTIEDTAELSIRKPHVVSAESQTDTHRGQVGFDDLFHQPRLRRESYGELVQIDGSEHRWFEQRDEPCTLLVFIDDATSRLMQLRFVPSESTSSYFEALRGYLSEHGCPVAFYSDKHSVFRVNRSDAKGGSGMTQFGRALAELNIEIICANSSQAKGRVERANRTLQDRLVKELRIENVSSIGAGNAFLPEFLDRFNERFAVRPAKTVDLHQALRLKPDRLNDVLCHREQRHVGDQLTLAYDRKQLILERSAVSEELGGQYVDLYDFADGRLEVRWKG